MFTAWYMSCWNCCSLSRSMLMFTLSVSVLVGRTLSAMFFAMSYLSFAAKRVFDGFGGVVFSRLYMLCHTPVSASCSSLLRSSWAYSPLRRFHNVVLPIPRDSAICWLLRCGFVVMSSTALFVNARFLSSTVLSSVVCSIY